MTKTMRQALRKRGVTIIELVVVFAIMSILMGLLFPAVQQARETARRAKCMNSIRQVTLATAVYESINGRYPNGAEGAGELSVIYAISPHLDMGVFTFKMDVDVSPFDPPNDVATASQPALLICPTDYFVGKEDGKGWCNYHSNAGSWVWTEKRWDGFFGSASEYEINGVTIPKLAHVTSSSIPDGLSNTVMFAEVVNGAGIGDGPKTKDDCMVCVMPPNQDNIDRTQAQGFFLARDLLTSEIPLDGNWRWRGYPWTMGRISRTWYNHLLPPNEPCWVPNYDFDLLVSPATSFHVSGVNVTMGDGSGRYVHDSVDKSIWMLLGIRDDGEASLLP